MQILYEHRSRPSPQKNGGGWKMIFLMIWGSTILQVANSFRRKKEARWCRARLFRQGGVSTKMTESKTFLLQKRFKTLPIPTFITPVLSGCKYRGLHPTYSNQLDHQLFPCQATTFSTTKETQYSRSELYCCWSRFGIWGWFFSVDRVSVGDQDIIYPAVLI